MNNTWDNFLPTATTVLAKKLFNGLTFLEKEIGRRQRGAVLNCATNRKAIIGFMDTDF